MTLGTVSIIINSAALACSALSWYPYFKGQRAVAANLSCIAVGLSAAGCFTLIAQWL